MVDVKATYVVRNPFVRSALQVSPQDRIPNEFELITGKWRPTAAITFRQHMGTAPRDLLWTSMPPLFLISDRVVLTLQANRITGWSTYPVEVLAKKGDRIQGYHGFVVTGVCGAIDRSRSKQVMRPPPVPNGKGYQAWLGLYFDENTWDGSDVFCPEGTGWVFVVDKVKRILEENRISNILFQPIAEIEITMW